MAAPTQLRAHGIDALKNRHFDAAADLLNRYLDAAPNDSEAELALAAARAGQGKHVAALTIFERHLEREPRSPSLHFNRGTTLERLGRKDDAVKAYKMALRLKPDYAKARQRLETLGGIAPPLRARPADEIPMVLAVDDGEDNGGGRPGRRRKPKGRWIHPAVLAALLLFTAALIGVVVYTMAPYQAGGYAAGAILSALVLLAGIQAVSYARRGAGRYPAPVGYVFLALGAVGLVNVSSFAVHFLATVDWQQMKRVRLEEAKLEALRNPGPQRRLSAEEAASAVAEADRSHQDVRRREVQKNIDDLNSSDESKLVLAVMFFSTSPPKESDPKTVVAAALEAALAKKVRGVRYFAVLALTNWGSRESIPKLKPLLTDRDSQVRSAAKKAIDALEK